MTGGSASARLREYVAVLRGIGLTESAIADAHGGHERPDEPLESYLRERLDGTDEATLHGALVDAIADSARGIDAPAEYWNHAPEVHLGELLAPYGCSLSIEPAGDADALADGRFVIRLTDAAGREYWTQFEYPDSPLGEDNYPALVHAVEEDLLAFAGLTIRRLRGPEGRWRFAMMTVDQFDALRERYGERLEIFGAPVLSPDQPAAFDDEDPPVPEWYEVTQDEAADDGLSIEVPETDSLDDLEPDGVEIEFEDMGDDPDTIVESVEGGGAGSASTASVTGGAGVEASDDQIESVFGDLSDVTLESEEAEAHAQPSTNGAVAIDGGTASTDADDPMEELFSELERDIADSEPETGENASAGRETDMSDLVGESSDGADEGIRTPSEAVDLTATELFAELGRRD